MSGESEPKTTVTQKHTCKYYKRKVVKLNRNLKTNGGSLFYKGELMIIRQKTKAGPFELARPQGSIHLTDEDDFEIIGDEKEVYGRT